MQNSALPGFRSTGGGGLERASMSRPLAATSPSGDSSPSCFMCSWRGDPSQMTSTSSESSNAAAPSSAISSRDPSLGRTVARKRISLHYRLTELLIVIDTLLPDNLSLSTVFISPRSHFILICWSLALLSSRITCHFLSSLGPHCILERGMSLSGPLHSTPRMEWNGPGTLTISSQFLPRGLTFSFTGNSLLLSLLPFPCGLGRPTRGGSSLRGRKRSGASEVGRGKEAGREGGVGGGGYKSLQARIRVAHGMQTAELSCGGAAIEAERERAFYCTYRWRGNWAETIRWGTARNKVQRLWKVLVLVRGFHPIGVGDHLSVKCVKCLFTFT